MPQRTAPSPGWEAPSIHARPEPVVFCCTGQSSGDISKERDYAVAAQLFNGSRFLMYFKNLPDISGAPPNSPKYVKFVTN
jgi:hypothetical protein